MKVRYTTKDGRMTFEADLQGRRKAFEFVAAVQEIFEETECGLCKSDKIVCHAQGYKNQQGDEGMMYSLRCQACGAQLDVVGKKDGVGLFVKRRDKDGKDPGKNGWYVYQRQQQPARQPQRQTGDDEFDVPFSGNTDDPGDVPF